jgi:sortase A
MFGFVAYQLWGTGIETARAQRGLESEFEQLLADSTPPSFDEVATSDDGPSADNATSTTDDATENATGTTDTTDASTDGAADSDPGSSTPPPVVIPVEAQNIPPLDDGDALARIEIPRLGVNDIVVAGVEPSDLKRGPGHFPDTPMPGQLGNAAIAGHRTTYGQPFHDVDKLQPGDEIIVTTLSGSFTYRVTGTQIVSPADYHVVATTDPNRANLTLTSCHPKWTARERIVVFSELDSTSSAPVGEPVLNYGRPIVAPSTGSTANGGLVDDQTPAGSGSGSVTGNIDGGASTGAPSDAGAGGVSGTLTETATGDDILADEPATPAGFADAFSESWFSDPDANPHVGMWGLAVSIIALGAYLLSRRFRRDWVGAVAGFVPFFVALYFFFQNVNRLLPPNL